MVSEIRIYVEGGGDQKDTKARFREGFSLFFKEIKEMARQKKICFSIIACGTRDSARRDFKNALNNHPNAFNILLVDSEDPVTVKSPKQHLINRDSWDLSGIAEDQIHLMFPTMENWIIADVDALARFYGKGLNKNAIPKNNNVQEVSKRDVESALKNATRKTQKKEYHKIKHGPKILGSLNIEIVRQKASYCDRLFTTLMEKIQN
jgi:hypothetical protein